MNSYEKKVNIFIYVNQLNIYGLFIPVIRIDFKYYGLCAATHTLTFMHFILRLLLIVWILIRPQAYSWFGAEHGLKKENYTKNSRVLN